jgi:hypothetical protein
MLELAAAHEVRTIVIILDRSVAYTAEDQTQVGLRLLAWLFERVTMLLGRPEDFGIAIADKPGGGSAADKSWLQHALELNRNGTEYVKPGGLVLPIVTATSDHVPLLQLADLVTASTTAAVAGRESGTQLAPLLRPMMHRNTFGHVGGAGLVLFPPGLRNLLHWVFQDTYSRPGTMSGWSLPYQGWNFYTDDGL